MREIVEHVKHQIDWSERTFGPGDRTDGVCAHIRKELSEIIESAGRDLVEWVDVIILAIDGAWRSGATAEEIVGALLTANPTRTASATASRLYEIRGLLTLLEYREGPPLRNWTEVAAIATHGAWAVGFTPREIIDAIVAKQAKNEARHWPDWRVADFNKPIEHVREG